MVIFNNKFNIINLIFCHERFIFVYQFSVTHRLQSHENRIDLNTNWYTKCGTPTVLSKYLLSTVYYSNIIIKHRIIRT